ncbi:hypothetical protein GTW51_01380 [Aurantimonas aggregata]|uniref:Uncharacterized protein n=1 Tax=Aurantimonas aggregata TaxID=2047720 RepID=A0A6L9MCE3_9HYPH|nr:hypothetical protein [Aurantimonas aggregata]NDV85346.1 hypothetical protein [Aurantimonas aggregata]
MKAILSGILIAGIIAVVASFALSEAQRPAYERYSTTSVRVGEPGNNLVGADWSGDDVSEVDS